VGLEVEQGLEPIEQNGFTIADFTPDTVELRFFQWKQKQQPVSAIDTLEPFRVTTLKR
jgi:hypothetical protein